MIEMDPTEYKHAAVSDKVLILVALFCGKETADKLLYEGDELCTIISLPQQNRSSATA